MDIKYTLVAVCHLLGTTLIVYFFSPLFLCFSACVLWMCIASFAFSYSRRRFLDDKIEARNRAVFITGCDTGFGNALAKRLDSRGFHVFASCLFPSGAGARELRDTCSERLHVLHMDVTKDESVQKAFEYVKENLGSLELWALVNNAGIVKGFSVDLSSVDDFRDCLEVNLMGPVRVTKAFLPLLKRSKGRIVNVTSAAGELALPFFTPYISSKYAAVGFTDCLRYELDVWGIAVVSIEPEIFRTGLIAPDVINKSLDAKLKGTKEDFASSLKDVSNCFLSFACPKIGLVIDDLESAVTLLHPHHTYKPRRNLLARIVCFSYEVMPRSWQIGLMKLALWVFFSKSKIVRNIVMKLASSISAF